MSKYVILYPSSLTMHETIIYCSRQKKINKIIADANKSTIFTEYLNKNEFLNKYLIVFQHYLFS